MGSSKKGSGGKQPRDTADADANTQQTPNTDMQDEDAGTAASGNEGRASSPDDAKKQTSKSERERGRGS